MLADVRAFLLERQARIKINPREARNVNQPISAEMKSLLSRVIMDWLESHLDVLTVKEMVRITGYGASSVVKWRKKEKLTVLAVKFSCPKPGCRSLCSASGFGE